jgi:hypothetical protein
MNNFAFCTITYGEKYKRLGDTIINQMTGMGYHFYVLTDSPSHYEGRKNVHVIPHTYSYFSYHQKRFVVQECLKDFSAAIFLDADVFYKEGADLSLLNNAEHGLHIFATFGGIGHTFLNDDINHWSEENPNARNTKYGPAGKKLIEDLGFKYTRDFHNNGTMHYLEHFLEGKWIIKKQDGKEKKFFEYWDKLAEFTDAFDINLGFKNTISAGEGASMSLAAFNSGINTRIAGGFTQLINTYFISNYQEKMDGTKPWNIAG